MVEMTIHADSCRGCQICIDICATDVIEFNEQDKKAVVKEVEDCIACLACTFVCPSNAIEHNNIHLVQNFYRDINFSRKLERFI